MKRAIVFSTFYLLLLRQSFSQIPQTISYQGVLTNASGQVVPNGNYSLALRLYDVSSGGAALWTETQPTVAVSNGIFNVLLGSVTPFNLAFDKQYYLGISVGGGSELTPRIALSSSPYSIKSLGVLGNSNVFPSSGNVGIGTTTPSRALHFRGQGAVFHNEAVATPRTAPFVSIDIDGYSAPEGILSVVDRRFQTSLSRTPVVYIENSNASTIADNYLLQAVAAGTTRFVLQQNGNVGIGTTSPGYLLDVQGSGTPIIQAKSTSTTGGAHIWVTNNSTGNLSMVSSGTAEAGNIFGTVPHANLQRLEAANGANFVIGTGPGSMPLIFSVNRAEAMRIINGGNVGIGTTTPGNILSVVQSSATDPIADAWTTYSSRRWKTNINTLEGALEKVQKLRGVSFDWKADGKHDVGLIAEEVGEVIPEVVVYEENGKDGKSVDYPRLVAVLIEAVKDQQKQIEALNQKVEGLSKSRLGLK